MCRIASTATRIDRLFDLKGTNVRAPGGQQPLTETLDRRFATIEVGLEHLEEAEWFEHLKIEKSKIDQHPLAPQVNVGDQESIRDDPYASLPLVQQIEVSHFRASRLSRSR
jgi:hypothetical protein